MEIVGGVFPRGELHRTANAKLPAQIGPMEDNRGARILAKFHTLPRIVIRVKLDAHVGRVFQQDNSAGNGTL